MVTAVVVGAIAFWVVASAFVFWVLRRGRRDPRVRFVLVDWPDDVSGDDVRRVYYERAVKAQGETT